MKHLIEALILVIPPIVYALWNGRNGLVHPSFDQVKTVALIMIVCVTLARFHALYYGVSPFIETVPRLLWWYVKAYLVAVTGYGLFFPPLMNFVLMYKQIKRAGQNLFPMSSEDFVIVFSNLSNTAVPDKWKWYRALGWKVRLIGYATLFLASVLWFCWSSFRSLESYLH